jgi:hypothetical protein
MSADAATQPSRRTEARLKTPRAAALAGILFSILLTLALVLLRLAVPDNPLEQGDWLGTESQRVAVGLNLVPFAGIAFLWFIGVLRCRLGDREDRFFATVFLGSGLLFLAMLFTAAAVAGAILMAHGARPETVAQSATFAFARALSYSLMNVYAVKIAGVFLITTSTIAVHTGIAARWIAYLGYAAAALLLLGSGFTDWAFMAFPLWILLLSGYVLIDDLRGVDRDQSRAHKAH